MPGSISLTRRARRCATPRPSRRPTASPTASTTSSPRFAFRRPVAAVHGDSHYFRIDKPLLDAKGQRLENFTRVETFGDHQENANNDVHRLKVDVDPGSREVFSYQEQIVPANRTAVPAP